ncbi:MAG: hypothetical protein PVI78_01105 [Anaerolineales bacterium]|jgi:phosphoglycerol transferase MdoB-like AlkP superfamily enzyme
MRLTPPKKNTFWISLIIAVLGLVAYIAGLLGIEHAWLPHLIFWLPAVGYILLALGNALKGF